MRKNLLAATAATLLLSTAAFAADMPIAPPPSYAPPPPADFGGWYLRGDIGFSNQKVKNVTDTNPLAYAPVTSLNQTSGFDTAGIFGVGVGYQFNNWFRADVTGQYRGSANFKGLDSFNYNSFGANLPGTDSYSASKSELLFLANAYVDLGTWWCVTPFIGAGVGTARVTVSNFTDTGNFISNDRFGGPTFQANSFNSAGSASKWNFAWAAHAGLAYKVNNSLTVELAYSYVNMGDGITGPTNSFDQVTNTTHAPFAFKSITSNDIKLGVRWSLDPTPVYVPRPLITKG